MTDAGASQVWLAQAKVNLALHVTGRRADGFHELDTLVVFADHGDRIRANAAQRLQLAVGGPFADRIPAGSGNLALKAAWALWTATDRRRGAQIVLEKALPVGAGLGGGSADAASVLLALNDLWQLDLSLDALAAIAATLGADVPLCLHSRAVRGRGTGDVIEPAAGIPDLPLVLVWPGVAVSTADVFAARDGPFQPALPPLPPLIAGPSDLAEWLAGTRNGLTGAAGALAPEIGFARAALLATPGCLFARMSGSGSACFGLYLDRRAADAAANTLAAGNPGWWVRAVTAR